MLKYGKIEISKGRKSPNERKKMNKKSVVKKDIKLVHAGCEVDSGETVYLNKKGSPILKAEVIMVEEAGDPTVYVEIQMPDWDRDSWEWVDAEYVFVEAT
tara:strand:- start:139 stop:438 length:300 start_codon:yes stop_codon:yes gene_type:complete